MTVQHNNDWCKVFQNLLDFDVLSTDSLVQQLLDLFHRVVSFQNWQRFANELLDPLASQCGGKLGEPFEESLSEREK